MQVRFDEAKANLSDGIAPFPSDNVIRPNRAQIQNRRNPEREDSIPRSRSFHSELPQVHDTLVLEDEIHERHAPSGFQYARHLAQQLLSVRTALQLMNYEVRHHHVESTVGKGKLPSVTFFHRHAVPDPSMAAFSRPQPARLSLDCMAIPHPPPCGMHSRSHKQQQTSLTEEGCHDSRRSDPVIPFRFHVALSLRAWRGLAGQT